MKITKIVFVIMLAVMPGMNMQAQDWKDILSGVASSIGEKVSEKVSDKAENISITGVWNYAQSECKFDRDNLLAKAGSELTAKKVEQRMADLFSKVGINESTVFTFNSDSTYTIQLGKSTLKGTYSFNKETKEITMVSRLKVRSTAKVTKNILSPDKMSLLFKADKLMNMVQSVTGTLAQKSSNKTINLANALFKKYEGMMLGIELNKQN